MRANLQLLKYWLQNLMQNPNPKSAKSAPFDPRTLIQYCVPTKIFGIIISLPPGALHVS